MYQWNWQIISTYRGVFAAGVATTLALTVLVMLLGTILGLVLALASRSKEPLVRVAVRLYVELFRALPILVVLIWFFYVLPQLTGITLSPFVTGLVVLSLHLAAFVSETVRSAIETIPAHQYESGLVLRLSPWQTMRHIILPQALQAMLPNLLGLYIAELKNSSLVSVIAVNELLHQANTLIAATYRPLEIYTVVAGLYLVMTVPLILIEDRISRSLGRSNRELST